LQAIRYLLWTFFRFLLPWRYRVRVHGLDQIRALGGPLLILPNHPAYCDPAILVLILWPSLRPRPVVFVGEDPSLTYRFITRLLNAIPIPYLARASAEARARTEKSLADTAAALRRGDNVLLWPAGHVWTEGRERIGSPRSAADLLREVPEAKVVLVRTLGLWGSSFSKAMTGTSPNLARRFLAGAGWFLANLLFLTPRRLVDITLEPVDRSRLPELRRETLNPWLEAWYNAPGPQAPVYVPYHFAFGPRTYEFPKPEPVSSVDPDQIKPEVQKEVAAVLAHFFSTRKHQTLDEAKLDPGTPLDQLGLDSLERMEVNLIVEQRFGFSGDHVPATVGELWALAQGLAERGPPKPAPPEWFRAVGAGPPEILGETVAEAFVARALANPKDVVVADDLAGMLTYERLLVGALILARRFRALEAENVGLMMPASVAGDVALLGIYLAGKLPVVLNWTTGPANLAHAARLMKLSHVVTARAFLDRTGIEVKGVSYLFLEEMRQQIGAWQKLRTFLQVRLRPGSVRRHAPRPDPERPAVVLFTSGSERAPKAVPLTHRNLLSNQRSGIAVFGMTRRDSTLGFLPTFHSFGLSVTTLLPILAGLRVVHHPDPTDASGLARKAAAYQVTILVGTPTFIGHIVDRAGPGQLAALRLLVVGAESCPPSLAERCARAAPNAALLEGYGITECSPVVSVNLAGDNRPGTLGRPLPGVEVCVTDLETEELLPPGRLGMLLVSGPTVFPGYIGYDGPAPFREAGGKRWYVTGDLAEVDAEGYIHFRGRLKRFLKAGGEMISLPALEEPLTRRWPPTDKGPRVAVEGVETPGGRRIVLFATEPVRLEEANRLLWEEGFRGVMRLDEVRQVKEIPVLGTGKTDYKVLRQRLTADEGAAASAP
jgi:long-chain-fatty-acid--[acyl-carrier-protein] ligase